MNCQNRDRLGGLSAWVITLRRSTERARQVQRLIDRCPVPCRVHDAVDGSALPEHRRDQVYRPQLHQPRYPFALSPGEIGCFLSHRTLWEEIVRSGVPQALILEDDVEFLPSFEASLRFASAHAGSEDYIQFQVRELNLSGRPVAEAGELQLVRPARVPLRTSAQLVTSGAAARLLEASSAFDRPVDAFIQMPWLHGARVLTAVPRSVVEVSADLGGSTIARRRGPGRPFGVLLREYRRAVYRFRISSRAQRELSRAG